MRRWLSGLLSAFLLCAVARAADAPPPAPDTPKNGAPAVEERGGAACTLVVADMHCGGCARGVIRAAKAVDGVKTVEVRLSDYEVDVTYDDARTDAEAVRAAVSKVYSAEIKAAPATTGAQASPVPAVPPVPASQLPASP